MNPEKLIRAWKDPESRGDEPDVEHPSGDIAIGGAEAEADFTIGPVCASISITLASITAATDYLSCWANPCEHTVYNGTCRFPGSYGCC